MKNEGFGRIDQLVTLRKGKPEARSQKSEGKPTTENQQRKTNNGKPTTENQPLIFHPHSRAAGPG
jgi:hypothetical protein